MHACMRVCVCLSIKPLFFIECYDFIVIDNAQHPELVIFDGV